MAVADSNERLFSVTRIRAVTPGATDLALEVPGTMQASGSLVSVYPRAIMVGTAGDVTVLAADDSAAVVLKNLAAGIWHPISPKKITAATALDVLAGY